MGVLKLPNVQLFKTPSVEDKERKADDDLKPTSVTALGLPVYVSNGVNWPRFHLIIVLSFEAERNEQSVGETASELTAPVCPGYLSSGVLCPTCHRRIMLS